MASLAEVFVSVKADTTDFQGDLKRKLARVDAKSEGGRVGQGFGDGFLGSFKGVAAGIGTAFAAVGVVNLFAGFISEAREAGAVTRVTENAIRATGGAARVTADDVGALAESISNKTGIDDEAVQSSANLLLCLEESAEALTRDRGWVTHDQLNVGDEVLTYDPADDTSRWEPILDFYRYQVDTELIHWKSKQIDVKTTPHHRWWTVGGSGYNTRQGFMTTEQISGHQIKVKIGGGQPGGFRTDPVLSDDIVELLGWVATEGFYARWKDQSKVRPPRVTAETSKVSGVAFSQSQTANPKHVARIRELVDRLVRQGHPVSETQYLARYNDSVMSQWTFSGDLGREVRRLLPGKKLTADLLGMLTRDQAELLLDTLVSGDGHTDRHGHSQYVQKDHGQLDVVAMLCAMLGIRTSVLGRGGDRDSLYLCKTNTLQGHAVHAERVQYSGVVWCPQVRTGIFMARNNGRTFWTGNTFKGVRDEVGAGNDVFSQATALTQDLAAAGFGSADSAAKMLGKALNDPIAGLTALGRAGVTFTEQQKEQIRTLVETGDTLGAQRIILEEVTSQVGGAAAAAADPMQKLGVIVGNLKERIGTALMPAITAIAENLGRNLPGMIEAASAGFGRLWTTLQPTFDYVRNTAIPALLSFGGFLADNRTVVLSLAVAVGAIVAAFAIYSQTVVVVTAVTKAWAAVQAVLNGTLLLNPIGIVVVALVALAAGLVVAYQRSETFRNIVQAAWQGIQQAVGFAWNNVIQPALRALENVLVNVVAPAVMRVWHQVVEPAFRGIAEAVRFAWGIIRPILELAEAVFRTVVGPAITRFWQNTVQPAMQGFSRAVTDAWNVVRPIFETVGRFISENVAPAFRRGVEAIGRAWDGLQEAAKGPVRFVVNTVINDAIIDNFNKVASFFGTTKIARLSLPRGFATGGFTGPGPVSRVAGVVHAGEHVIRAESTRAMNRAMPGLLDHINRRGRLPGYQTGGRVADLIPGRGWSITGDPRFYTFDQMRTLTQGWTERDDRLHEPPGVPPRHFDTEGGPGIGDGIGDLFSNIADALTDPLGALRRAVEGILGGIGDTGLAGMLRGIPAKLVQAAADKIRGLFSGDAAGGGLGKGTGAGGWQWQMNVLRKQFPGLALNSGFRPGAITATGNPSYHGKGRAVDVPPRMDVFNWIAALYGGTSKELIFSPAGGRQIHNGRPHMYSGVTRSNHFDHVHWAYDQGGWLKPGVTVAQNNTGQPERILGPHDEITATIADVSLERFAQLLLAAVRQMVGGYDAAVGRQVSYGRMP